MVCRSLRMQFYVRFSALASAASHCCYVHMKNEAFPHSVFVILLVMSQVYIYWNATTKTSIKHNENPHFHQNSNTTSIKTSFKTNKLLVLVLSARDAIEQRTAIRKTWAANKTNVKFIIGDKSCSLPLFLREKYSCSIIKTSLPSSVNITMFYESRIKEYLKIENLKTENLKIERDTENDVVLVDLEDSYRNLARKLKLGYRWAVEDTDADFILKIDDDSYARIEGVEEEIMSESSDSSKMQIYGNLRIEFAILGEGWVAAYHSQLFSDSPTSRDLPIISAPHSALSDVKLPLFRTFLKKKCTQTSK